MSEEWKPVPGFAGRYIVSSHGRVAKLLKGYIGKTGYRVVALSANRDECKLLGAHQIVMSAFDGPPKGRYVHHKDNDKTHNKRENLEYVTPQENTLKAFEDGLNRRAESRGQAKLKWAQVRVIRSLLKDGKKSQAEIAKMFGVFQTTISHIKMGRTWRVEHER